MSVERAADDLTFPRAGDDTPPPGATAVTRHPKDQLTQLAVGGASARAHADHRGADGLHHVDDGLRVGVE